jgi:RsmE family RNA methyltransferase
VGKSSRISPLVQKLFMGLLHRQCFLTKFLNALRFIGKELLNTLIYTSHEIVEEYSPGHHRVCLKDKRRHNHVTRILHIGPGDSLRVGQLDGDMGTARVIGILPAELVLDVVLDSKPPDPSPVALVLALPRPLVIRRILADVATFGVKQIYLFQSRRVEKSFWQSPVLAPPAIREHLIKGLEQGQDTRIPRVELRPHFGQWIDELAGLAQNSDAYLAQPRGEARLPHQVVRPSIIAIGPEGGLTDDEVRSFQRIGFAAVDLGSRLLRVETAVSAVLGRLTIT